MSKTNFYALLKSIGLWPFHRTMLLDFVFYNFLPVLSYFITSLSFSLLVTLA